MATTKATSVPAKEILAQPVTLIRQRELRSFIALRNKIEKMQGRLDTATESLKNLLQAGVKVEEGTHIANINLTERRNPSWKGEAIGLADQVYGLGEGEKWAEKVIERTEPVSSVRLVVK